MKPIDPPTGETGPRDARALAQAYSLHRLLGELNDLPAHGAGSYVESAWGRMDEVIQILEEGGAGKDWRAAQNATSGLSRLALAQCHQWPAPSSGRIQLKENMEA